MSNAIELANSIQRKRSTLLRKVTWPAEVSVFGVKTVAAMFYPKGVVESMEWLISKTTCTTYANNTIVYIAGERFRLECQMHHRIINAYGLQANNTPEVNEITGPLMEYVQEAQKVQAVFDYMISTLSSQPQLRDRDIYYYCPNITVFMEPREAQNLREKPKLRAPRYMSVDARNAIREAASLFLVRLSVMPEIPEPKDEEFRFVLCS